jgi:hypothetical protein
MVLGLFVAAIGSVPVAAQVMATPPPVVTITAPTNGLVTNQTYMNVTWTVSPLPNIWNWTAIGPQGTDPPAVNNVSGASNFNFTGLADGRYTVNVTAVHVNVTGVYHNVSALVDFTVVPV